MLVGRSAELDLLDRLLGAARGGRGGRVLVVGDPGIGKTALLATAARRATRLGMTVLRVRAADGEEDLPFALLDDLYRVGGEPVPTPAPGVARRGDALLDLLVRRATGTPLLLVLDDAHSADDSSLAALELALGRAADLPVAALAAARPSPRVEARLAAWDRLDLTPLAVDAAVALLRSVLGAAPDGGVLERLAVALRGHPLALSEAARLLTPDQLAGSAPLPERLPVAPALLAAWGAALRALPDGTRAALLDLAVAGERPDLLAALARDSGVAADDLDAAVAARLVVLDASGSPRFTHPLVRDVVLDDADGAQARQAHRRAARAARALGLEPAVVVRHLGHGAVLADETTAAAIAAEAVRAERMDHLDAAVRAWELAARLSPAPQDRVARALQGVRVLERYGVGGSSVGGLLDLVGTAELDPESAARIGWLRSWQRTGADPRGSLATQWAAIATAESRAPALLPALLHEAALTAWTLGDPAEGLRAATAYARLEPAPGSRPEAPPWTGTALLAAAHLEAGDVRTAVRLRAEAIAAAAGFDPVGADLGLLFEVVLLDDLLLDDGAAAETRVVVAEQRLQDAAEPLACVLGIRAWRARARGEWGQARRLLARGRPLADAVGATGAQRGMAALAVELAALCEDEESWRRQAERLRAVAGRWGDRRRLATLDRALGLRALAAGRYEAAVAAAAAAADLPFLGRGLRDGVLTARVDVVEALVRTGATADARARAEDVRSVLEELAQPLARALAWRVAALVAPSASRADEAFARSLAEHAAAGDPFERARTELLLGEHLRRQRRRRDARARLEDAVRRFASLGAEPWVQRAGIEARACGGDGTRDVDALAVLTPQERAVAGAAATGRSTREVAEALVLSPRTVEYHLGNVYRKLGVHGRAALAARLAGSSAGSSVSAGAGD